MIKSNKILITVIILSVLACVLLIVSVWNMNFWPTDAKAYYFQPTLAIPHLHHISEIHTKLEWVWLHGKEVFLLLASFVQRLIHDSTTLRPFILVASAALGVSFVLFYLIGRKLWGKKISFIVFLFFLTSFWPYMYVLFCKHQTLGLMFFLLAAFLLTCRASSAVKKGIMCLLSGACLGAAVFSSPTVPVYFPFYAALFFRELFLDRENRHKIQSFLIRSGEVLAGMLAVFAYLHLPDLIGNFKGYLEYINISSGQSHFYYNQPVLQQWIFSPIAETRGGWVWVVKYFLLIMPVLFPLYLASAAYLIGKMIRGRATVLRHGTALALSFSPAVLIEIKHIAQYGGNYFPCIIGILFLVGYVFHLLSSRVKQSLRILLVIVFVFHVGMNAYAFVTDIYPSRMATTFLSQKIEGLGVRQIFTYGSHPHRSAIIDQLNPELKKKLRVHPVQHIMQAPGGYIIVPPVTKDTIFLAAHSDYTQFDQDVFLNELLYKGNLEDYAVASFPTLASSRYWYQEEEILTYRDLVLNQPQETRQKLGRAWILDAGKLLANRFQNIPHQDYIHLARDHVRNIGTKNKIYQYPGIAGILKKPSVLYRFRARIYKEGKPSDSLKAYAYRINSPDDPVWVPSRQENMSLPVYAAEITDDAQGGLVDFVFDPPLVQDGPYMFKIYRAGTPDDENYYRIYTDFQQRQGS